MRTRAGGILVHEGKVLLQRKVHEAIWAVPGGRVEARETVEAALVGVYELKKLGSRCCRMTSSTAWRS